MRSASRHRDGRAMQAPRSGRTPSTPLAGFVFLLVLSALALAACTTGPPPPGQQGGGTTGSAARTLEPPAPGMLDELRLHRVVFVRQDGIYTARADGTQLRKLVDLTGAFEYQPDVSPDGRWLALRVDDGPSPGTWLVASDGTRAHNLTMEAGLARAGSPDWAPDSRRLAVVGQRNGERRFGIYVVSMHGGDATRITPPGWEAQYPAWSPDGTQIAFTRVDPSVNAFDLYVTAADGSQRRRLTRDAAQDIREAFQAWRDGTRPITDVFAPEMVWRIEGHSLASGEYGNKQAFIDEVLTPFGARFASSSAPFRPVVIRSVFADADTVIVVWDGRGIANDGQPYQNSYVWIMKMRDGKVIDGTAFYDSLSFNDLWARVEPQS